LDENRLRIAPPKGWSVPPRSSKYVFRAQKSTGSNYPCIIVTAEQYTGKGIADVGRENVEEFAGRVAAALEKDRSAVQPIEIGDFVGVTYQKRAKEPRSLSKVIELLFLDTVVGGREYSIHLRAKDGSLEEGRPCLYAVVNGIEFLQSGTQEGPKEEPSQQVPSKDLAKPSPKEEPPADESKTAPVEKPEPAWKEKPRPDSEEQPKAAPDDVPGGSQAKPKKKPTKGEGLKLNLDKLDDVLDY
jgi:hypothetical protein